MIGRQKLLLLWAGMVLMATLCPGVQSKRGGGFLGRMKGMGKGEKEKEKEKEKAPPTQSKGGSSKQGLKLAGAAVAGAVGGAAIGYGLGSLGKPRHGYGNRQGYGYDRDSSKDGFYSPESQRAHNKSAWHRYRNTAAPCPTSTFLLTIGPVLPFLIGAWVRGF